MVWRRTRQSRLLCKPLPPVLSRAYLDDELLELGVDVPGDVQLLDLDVGDHHLLGCPLVGVDADQRRDVELVELQGAREAQHGVAVADVLEAGGGGEADAAADERGLGQADGQGEGLEAGGVEEGDVIEGERSEPEGMPWAPVRVRVRCAQSVKATDAV